MLRIAVVQFAPKIGRVHQNIARAHELTSRLVPRSVDLVCLPEMIFSGYAFPSSPAVAPHLELPQSGPTSLFCADLSKRLGCYVAAGYPERLLPFEVAKRLDDSGAQVDLIGANSAVLYDPDGNWIGGYRKTNLYPIDMTWALPGTGFATFTLPPPLGTVCLGICMDLNPQPPALWSSSDGPYEIAMHCIDNSANVLIMLNAWLDSGIQPEEQHDWYTIHYWSERLRPLWENSTHKTAETETAVVICNRTGGENDFTFAGTSAAFRLKGGSGSATLLHVMGRHEEAVHVWNV